MMFKAAGSIALSMLISSLATGCFLVPSSDDDDDTRADFHDVTVRWHLKKLDGTAMSACPAGFTKLVTHLYKTGFVEPPDSIIRTPCTPDGSLTQSLPTAGEVLDESTRGTAAEGHYDYEPRKDIYMDVTEETEETFAAQTPVYNTKLTSDLTIDFDIYPDGGVGVAAWTLVSSLTTSKLASCAAAGVDEIEYAVRPYSDDTAPLVVGGAWPCDHADPYFYYSPRGNFEIPDAEEHELGVGHTKGYAPGDYFVELRAKRAGTVVGRSMSSMSMDGENSAIRMADDEISISDR
jgi:hypothetical protein